MGFDTHFLTRNDAFGFSQSPSNSLPDVFDNTLELDGVTLIGKISTALVTGIGGKEGAVCCKDFIRKEPEEFGDFDEDMEDLIIEFFSQPVFEIRECSVTRQMSRVDTGIDPKMFPSIPIPNGMHEVLHGGISFKIAKEFDQKEAHGIVGEAGQGVLMGYDRSDKREVNQGSDESGKSTGDSAIGMNFDVAALI